MMTSFQMAWLHFKRQKLQSLLLVLSLAMALTCSGLLLRLFALSQSRYDNLPTEINAILGPKSGGIEILLGALNNESKFHSMIPENLFRTLRAGADLRFEDGSVISSKDITQAVIPIAFVGAFEGSSVIATDESFFAGAAPAIDEIWIGSGVAEVSHLKVGDFISIDVKGTISKNQVQKKLRIDKVLEQKNNSWDQSSFVNLMNTEAWFAETQTMHPVWKNKILNYVLIKMKPQGFSALQTLVNDRTVSQLIWVADEKQKLQDLTTSAKDFGLMIVLVIFALAGFSIFGMMSIRLQTLRVSVATLEAIGYLPKFIFSWIFYEALLVGVSAASIAVVLEFISFIFVKSSLGSTWLVPITQSGSLKWSALLIAEGISFSLLGAMISVGSLLNLQIHSELKTG